MIASAILLVSLLVMVSTQEDQEHPNIDPKPREDKKADGLIRSKRSFCCDICMCGTCEYSEGYMDSWCCSDHYVHVC
ncbi:unnamed protein product, partial [Mesorhabditis belari]|uniref:Uncharacterized protein n=1 Tax=Mesorhabditis belari TaxID=2138241 RepID=A0AAF3FCP4_9BILA